MRGDSGQFPWARERLRVLSADTPQAAVREYEQMRRNKPLTDAQRYGLALARLQDGKPAVAAQELSPLLDAHPGDPWITLALAQVAQRLIDDALGLLLLDRRGCARSAAAARGSGIPRR